MATVDRLTSLLERFHVRTHLLHTGPLCGTTRFDAAAGRGFLHVLREGVLEVTHQGEGGREERLRITEPSLVFYPRPLDHTFHTSLAGDVDLACATLELDGGASHPLVTTLPRVLVIPLDAAPSLAPALDLLFAEVDNVSCGRQLLADRIFDVVLVQLLRWLLDNARELNLPEGLVRGLSDDRIARSLVAVHSDPGRSWTLETMAREATMSRSAFAARFRELLGTSPGDYLVAWRMSVAQSLLREGVPVARVAGEVGYATPAAFSRAFSQRLGLSPRGWLAAS